VLSTLTGGRVTIKQGKHPMNDDAKTKIYELMNLVGGHTKDVAKYKIQMRKYIESGRFREAISPLSEILRLDVARHKKERLQKTEKETNKRLHLAHYTSVETVFSILQRKGETDGFLRLYDAFYLNDPKEGNHLRDFFAEDYEWLSDVEDTEAFICSFVGWNEGCEDELMYWQSYGKRGLGCSILLSEYFSTAGTLYPVSYGPKGVDDAKRKFRKYLELGNNLINKCTKEEQNGFATEFWKAFDEIKFMYKDVAYEYEREYRMVRIAKPGEKIEYDLKGEGPYLRKYIEDERLEVGKVLASGSKVTIGPAVRKANHLSKNLEKLAKKRGIFGSRFTSSDISYQKFW